LGRCPSDASSYRRCPGRMRMAEIRETSTHIISPAVLIEQLLLRDGLHRRGWVTPSKVGGANSAVNQSATEESAIPGHLRRMWTQSRNDPSKRLVRKDAIEATTKHALSPRHRLTAGKSSCPRHWSRGADVAPARLLPTGLGGAYPRLEAWRHC